MKIKQVTPLESLAERRQFGRLKIAEPRICRVHVPQSQELWIDQGILVNISLGGIYLICNKQPPFEKDDIRFLTLHTPSSDPETHHLGLHVLVVRTEQRQIERHQFAVALRIISDPVYYSLQESNCREFTASDKARIMYQYYDLNKKAYEIINNTPDIRPDKIKNIKYFIDRGSYKIESEKITQGVINEMFLEDIFLQKI
jgi:anti-sigma28 factor (negative regulator of flagellin synthesis)